MNTYPTNKAAAIRDVLLELGVKTRTRDVIRRVYEKCSLEVTPQQVSNEKGRIARVSTENRHIEDLPVSVLKKVKALVDELGSTSLVRRALDELDELTRKH